MNWSWLNFKVDILPSLTSTKVIESLEKIFCSHGLPRSLKTDNGTQFVFDEFERFLKKNDIEHRTSTPLWPQANGEVKRQNRSLLKTRGIAKAEKKNVSIEMRKLLTAYRTTPHSSTGVAPVNREIRSKIPELGNSRHSDGEARDKDSGMKQERNNYAEEKRRARESDPEPGDLVLLKQRKENKLSTTYGALPYTVSKKHGNEVIMSSPEGVNVRRNVADVKKYVRGDTTGDEQVAEDDPSEEDNTGRITEPQGRPVRERRPPEYLKDYEVYELC